MADSERPCHKELTGKLRQARELIETGKWAPVEPVKTTPDFCKLDLFTLEEQDKALLAAIGEIVPEHYSGTRPPQRSYEPKIAKREMFAFTWESGHFKREMYFKFSVTQERLWLVSFHESEEKRGG